MDLDWIAKWAQLKPEQTAITDLETGEKFSYEAVNRISCDIANYLHDRIKEGDRVAVLMEQSPFLVMLFSACQRLGAILVPLNYKLSTSEIGQQLKDSQPSVFIYSEVFEEQIALLKDSFETMKLIDFKDEVKKNSKGAKKISKYRINEEAPVFLFYTTGTTAKPKGVLYTNKMLFWNSLNTSMQLGISSEDCTINILPPYHTSGWNIFLTPLLHNGGHITILKKFNPDKILHHLESEKVTLFLALPTILQMISKSENFEKADLSNLKYIISGGEALSQEQIAIWKNMKNANVRPGYGLTEAGPSITSLHQDFVFSKANSIGKPNFYVDLKVVDFKGNEVGENEIGELCIKGEIVTPGYWNNSVATKDKIKKGWFHTGDLAYKDADGFFFLKGRIDDMYITGGENIFPQEIESVLKQHPDIQSALVLPFDDDIWGRKGVAFIKTSSENLSVKEIQEFMKDKLAKFKQPKEYIFLKDFPITGFGKISRKDLIRFYNDNQKKRAL